MKHKLTIVIVSYNVKHYLAQCLRSVQRAAQGIDCQVIVVDNHSRDDSVAYIRAQFPQVDIIVSNHNNGFSYANNMAIRQSQSEYILLLNPDTILSENALSDMLHFMDTHPQAGGAGVHMLNVDGSNANESRRGIPTLWTAFCKMSGLCERFPQSKRFAHYYLSYLPWDEANQIEIISGACFILRREAIEQVGLLDEDFFMYGEDIDLSFRLLKGGWENWYIPTNILHYKGASTNHTSFRYVHVFYKAMHIFFRKHYHGMSILLSLPISMAIYTKAAICLIKNWITATRKSLGFVMRKQSPIMKYQFLGNEAQQKSFATFAAKHGLQTYEYTESQGREDSNAIPVFDATGHSYAEIFQTIQSTHPKLGFGIFYPDAKELITPHEVIC